jgi:glycosyltransferase involved in cell wall biosynthesis
MPAITTITATRNRPRLLRRTLENVRAQRLQDWEAIVVDDGDGSGMEAARSFNDPRIRAVMNPGTGQVDARNAGVAHASSPVLHLLDDDDRWTDPHHLERVVSLLENAQTLVYRQGWLVVEDHSGDHPVELERRAFQTPVTLETLHRDNTLLTSGVAYPTAFHDALGGFDSTMGNYWDWDWFLRAATRYGLQEIAPPAVLMSWRGTNTSHNPHQPERVAFLERLCAKHDLGRLESKNHFTVLG